MSVTTVSQHEADPSFETPASQAPQDEGFALYFFPLFTTPTIGPIGRQPSLRLRLGA